MAWDEHKFIGRDNAANGVSTSNVVSNADGTVLERLEWVQTALVGTVQIANTTEDLNPAASTYDLFTGTTQPVILKALTIKMPTGAAGGALTSISIQTDDATPGVIISSTLGAVANLTSEADIGWSGEMRIDVGTKIQLTIAGGAHGSEYITKIAATYESTVAGGTLA